MTNKKPPKQFSAFFFINLFFSLAFSLLIFFLFIRLKTTENSFGEYFSKVLSNFQQNFEDSFYTQSVKKWFNPELKSDNLEQFNKFKLSILAKTMNTYFNNLLVDTQNNVVTENLYNFISKKKSSNLELLKNDVKQHILNNPDLKEVSTYDLEGNKIFGIKFRNTPDYVFSKELISDLSQSKNLLIKQGSDKNIILLSLIEDKEKKPFIIVSQSIHYSFFDRILKHLNISDNIFYLKDSENFVLFDNQNTIQSTPPLSTFAYRVFNTLTKTEESNLRVNLNNVSYSIGTLVKKNNHWGNITALFFFLVIFIVFFLFIDLSVSLLRKYALNAKRVGGGDSYPTNQEIKSSKADSLASNFTTIPTNLKTSLNNLDTALNKSSLKTYELNPILPKKSEPKPLTLEQYLLKEKKDKL